MKTFEYTAYGSADVLRLIDVAPPVPKDDEVLIRVRAASVNAADWHLMRGQPFPARLATGGLRRPRPMHPGADVAGEIAAVGRQVTRFQPGDAVFGTCRGAFAEYACATEDRLVSKPDRVSFEEAAAVPLAATTALQGLRDAGRLQPGQRVLVEGASGGVGTFAVQIAKALGADVTAVCSPRNLHQARASGADRVIDYTRTDFTRDGPLYDLIFGANAHHGILAYRRALTADGTYVMGGGGGAQMLQGMLLGPLLSVFGRKTMRFFLARMNQPDLLFLRELLASGAIKPAIDRRYALHEVADAIRYVEQGHAKGKVVITVG